MTSNEEEDKLLRSVAMQNANSILLARRKAEEALVTANESLQATSKELAVSLALMRATLEATTDAMLVTSVDGTVNAFNEQFVRMWRHGSETMASRQHRKLLEHASQHFADAAAFLRRVEGIYATSEEAFDELRLLDGRVIERFSKIQIVENAPVGRVWSFRDVTERKHSEELRFRLAAIVESSDDAIISKTLDGIITTWNAGAERMFGYTAEEAVGQPITMLFPPDRLGEETTILDRLRHGLRIEHYETVRLRKGGAPIQVSLSVSPVKDASGRIVGASKIARDITAQKVTEEAVRRSEAELRTLVDSIPQLAWMADPDGQIRWYNHRWYEFTGTSPEQMQGWGWQSVHDPEMLPAVVERWKYSLETGEPFEMEFPLRGADGSYRWFLTRVQPLRDGAGQILRWFGTNTDVSMQREQEQALKLSEARLRAVVEASPECVKIVAPDGSLEFMNPAGLAMIEGESEPAVRGACVFDLIAPEHRATWMDHHQRVCSGERLSWEYEIVGLRGTRRWMETHAVPLPLPDGNVAQLAVTREITARKHAEQEREELLTSERAARTEAERASRLKDEFLATLSHELRTPLSAILGWSQLLTSGDVSEGDLRQGLDAIQRNARTQTQLIEDLLDMSRIISGKVRLDVQRIDLATVVDAAVESVRPAADAKEIRLRKILDPHAGPVSGDPTRLQQVVWNLLNNAIKFTSKGGRVDVLLERVNSHLEITVHDSGVGIKPELLPVIFERFRQADSSTTRSYGGLGLGLSIVKSLVELHGGTVRAKSAGEGQGATFVVALPLAPIRISEQREHPTTSKTPPMDQGLIDLTGVKVLVVDDEPDARQLFGRLLTQCNAEVCSASSASEGLDRLRTFRPDVLVSDIGMPHTDGYEFIRQVRRLPLEQGGKTPAIALTAFARSEDRTRAMIAGFQVHISKPIEPPELVATIGSLMGRLGK